MQLCHTTIEVDACVGIGGGVDTLLLVEMVSLPIGELGIFADALTEEIGPEFLKAEIFDSHSCGDMLKINPSCRMESFMTVSKHAPIVVKRKTNF